MKDSSKFLRYVSKGLLNRLSLFILIFWIVIAIANFLGFFGLNQMDVHLSKRLMGPSHEAWLGYDSNGLSLVQLIADGATTTLAVSLGTVATSLLIGVPLGALAGYNGGWIDMFISRVVDIVLAFPPLLLPISIAAFFGGGLTHVVLALSLSGWVAYARVVRAQMLTLKEREFVYAALAMGAGNTRIISKHLFPLLLSPLVVQATFALAGAVLSEAGLSFLGLGVGTGIESWGGILSDGRHYLLEAPHIIFVPALSIFSLVFALNFVGEALRVTFDPKSKIN